MQMNINEKSPNFELPSSSGKNVSLSDYLGKKVILYFYPKDNTPGWATEAGNFRDYIEEFKGMSTVVLGVSKDSIKSHLKFIEKYDINFELLSDESLEVNKLYDVWQLKKMMGKEYFGTVRSTFIINEEGILVKEFRKVRVKGHAKEVYDFVKEMK